MQNQTQSLKQKSITESILPFMKKRLEREIDLLTERITEKVNKENAFLRIELAKLKAENIALKGQISRLIGTTNESERHI